MPVYQHPKSRFLWCRFTIGGVKVRRSTGTASREAAEEFESKLRADLWRQLRLGERPAYTWGEAVERWAREANHRSFEQDRERLKWFEQYLSGVPLRDIDSELVQKLRLVRREESSPSTANRYMAQLRAILRKAEREWEWIERAPVVPMYPIEKVEPRFLTRQQAAQLLKHLPEHLAEMAEFNLETGLRMRNVTGLTWSQLDLPRAMLVIPAARAKAGETISVPLSARARAILRARRGEHETYVFTYRGKPIDDANGRRFKEAARDAGVPWLRWHDLRHTWASWHIQAGTPPHILQELGAWSSFEMVKRYGHLTVDHLRGFVEHRKGTPKKARAPKRRASA